VTRFSMMLGRLKVNLCANPETGSAGKTRRSPWRLAAIQTMVAACLVPGALHAATVAEIAQDKSRNRQEMLEAGARREGALMLYATGTQIQPLIDAFSKLYPYIKVSMPRASSEDVTRKVVEEYGAGLYQVGAIIQRLIKTDIDDFGLGGRYAREGDTNIRATASFVSTFQKGDHLHRF